MFGGAFTPAATSLVVAPHGATGLPDATFANAPLFKRDTVDFGE